MIGIDTWEGFLILLIIPLLYWHQRSRSALRVVPISTFRIITRSTSEELPPPRRFFRLSRNQRFFLFTGTVLSLALSYNGIHTTEKGPEPGKWLVFLDNTHGLSAQFKGEPILQEITSGLRTFSKNTHEADNFLLVTTSPTPQISDNLDRRAFSKKLDEVRALHGFRNMEDLGSLLAVMASGDNFKGVILVSPRSKAWKEKTSTMDQPLITIPVDRDTLLGNAGFSSLEVTPVARDLYEVYGTVTSDNLKIRKIKTILVKGDGTRKSFSTPLDVRGEGTIQFTESFLPASRSTLSLELNDNLLIDNSLTIIPPKSRGQVSIKLEGSESPFIQIALSSYDDFNLLTEGNRSTSLSPITILDKPKPGKTIDSPTLIIFPSENFIGLEIARIWAAPMRVIFHPGHPATRNARFRQFRAARILQTNTPEGFEVLAAAEGIPVILAGNLNKHRTVIWNFDPEDNSIYLDPAFPVLLRDTINWLAQSKETRIESGGCLGNSFEAPACSSLIEEAGTINIPDLSDLEQRVSTSESENRQELGNVFLVIAFLLILILTFERVHTQGKI